MLQVHRRRASKKQCREAYRRLAKRIHPDKSRDHRASAAFTALRDAYEFLSDEQRRSQYDVQLASEHTLAQKMRLRRALNAGLVGWRIVRASAHRVRQIVRAFWKYRKLTLPLAAALSIRYSAVSSTD